jgi:hypothetical protein
VSCFEQGEAVAAQSVLEARTPEDAREEDDGRRVAHEARQRAHVVQLSLHVLGAQHLEHSPQRIEVKDAGRRVVDAYENRIELERIQRPAGRHRPAAGPGRSVPCVEERRERAEAERCSVELV